MLLFSGIIESFGKDLSVQYFVLQATKINFIDRKTRLKSEFIS